MAQTVKCLPEVRETRVRSLGWEDPLEKEMATHSITLAWKIPRTEEPGGLQSMGSQSRTRLSDFTLRTFHVFWGSKFVNSRTWQHSLSPASLSNFVSPLPPFQDALASIPYTELLLIPRTCTVSSLRFVAEIAKCPLISISHVFLNTRILFLAGSYQEDRHFWGSSAAKSGHMTKAWPMGSKQSATHDF